MDILEQFGINGKLLLVQIFNFAILLLILKKLLYKPITDILEKRRTAVAESLKASEDMKEEQENFSKKVEQEMEQARGKAQEVVARAQEQASATLSNAQAEAAKKSEEMIVLAKKAITSEKETLMKDVEDDIVALVTQATGKVLGKEVDGKHDALIKEEISTK